jgi:hypothetical protein
MAFFSPVTFVSAAYASGEEVMHYRSKGYITIARRRETTVLIYNSTGGQHYLFLVCQSTGTKGDYIQR